MRTLAFQDQTSSCLTLVQQSLSQKCYVQRDDGESEQLTFARLKTPICSEIRVCICWRIRPTYNAPQQ